MVMINPAVLAIEPNIGVGGGQGDKSNRSKNGSQTGLKSDHKINNNLTKIEVPTAIYENLKTFTEPNSAMQRI